MTLKFGNDVAGINIRDINSTEEIDNLLLKVSDSFMGNYLNIIKKNKTKKK